MFRKPVTAIYTKRKKPNHKIYYRSITTTKQVLGGHKKQAEVFQIIRPKKPEERIVDIYPPQAKYNKETLSNSEWRQRYGRTQVKIATHYHDIFPTVCDVFRPRINLNVHWPSSNRSSYFGNQLTPTETAEKPNVKYFIPTKPGQWTLIMFDPDAPSRDEPIYGEWLHWLIVNIPGSNVSEGKTIVDYVCPSPPENSGGHRYIFLLCEQKGGQMDWNLPFISDKTAEGRSNFSSRKFIREWGLVPKGLSFFTSFWDAHVPNVEKSLGVELKYIIPKQRSSRKTIPDNSFRSF
eukprot:TRINITY_DN8503_c0_g1_i1.p1 TRINITY_DN8503_c0_g1~~TRINITY_DN8503_c0_g1_i1.p1  ORF type:complete len:292 (-),score=45.13 TRINITY_DN8503_c0_g1_i1:19-894(-)